MKSILRNIMEVLSRRLDYIAEQRLCTCWTSLRWSHAAISLHYIVTQHRQCHPYDFRMSEKEKDIVTIEVQGLSEAVAHTSAHDQQDMRRMGKKQQFVRSFHIVTSVAFTSCVMGTWELLLVASPPALIAGGTAGLFWSCIWGYFGQSFIVLSLAEMASMAPTAGGQYHWVKFYPFFQSDDNAKNCIGIRVCTPKIPESVELHVWLARYTLLAVLYNRQLLCLWGADTVDGYSQRSGLRTRTLAPNAALNRLRRMCK